MLVEIGFQAFYEIFNQEINLEIQNNIELLCKNLYG